MGKTIGIIGAGNISRAVAKHLLKAGHQVLLSNSRGPESLNEMVAALGNGITAVTTAEAAKADIVVLALPWTKLDTVTGLTDWKDKLVIDATNHYISVEPEFITADLGDRASSEVTAEHVPGADLVKAFNTLFFKVLEADPAYGGGKRVLFYSGGTAKAKQTVNDLIDSMGFSPIDLGDLHHGSKLHQAKGPLSGKNLIEM